MHDTLGYIAHEPIHRAVPPQRDDLLDDVRVERAVRAAALATTRSCTARARCCARCPATAGSSSPPCGPTSATCGRTPASSCCSWAASSRQDAEWSEQPQPRLVAARQRRPPRRPGRRPRPQPRLPRDARAVAARPRPGRLRVDRRQRRRRQHVRRSCAGGTTESVVACVANFAAVPHDGYRLGLPFAGRWDEVLNTDAGPVRRQRRRQPRGRRGRRRPAPRPPRVGTRHPPAAGHDLAPPQHRLTGRSRRPSRVCARWPGLDAHRAKWPNVKPRWILKTPPLVLPGSAARLRRAWRVPPVVAWVCPQADTEAGYERVPCARQSRARSRRRLSRRLPRDGTTKVSSS